MNLYIVTVMDLYIATVMISVMDLCIASDMDLYYELFSKALISKTRKGVPTRSIPWSGSVAT